MIVKLLFLIPKVGRRRRRCRQLGTLEIIIYLNKVAHTHTHTGSRQPINFDSKP